jgi:hypothetical protein
MDDDRLIVEWLAELSSASLPAAHLADAQTIWWRAHLQRRRTDHRRAQWPVDLMEWIQLVAAVATSVATVLWAIPSLTLLARLIAR